MEGWLHITTCMQAIRDGAIDAMIDAETGAMVSRDTQVCMFCLQSCMVLACTLMPLASMRAVMSGLHLSASDGNKDSAV
jgi:hypothetical protein